MVATLKKTSLFFLLVVCATTQCMQQKKQGGSPLEQKLNTELLNATEANDSLETLKNLLELKADPNAFNNNRKTPLWFIMHHKYSRHVDVQDKAVLLLDSGARVDTLLPGFTPFHIAAYNCDLNMCHALIEAAQTPTKYLLNIAKTVLTIHHIYKAEKKLYFPKPLLFLILNNITNIKLPLEKKEYSNLHTILNKKAVSFANKFAGYTAYQLVENRYEQYKDKNNTTIIHPCSRIYCTFIEFALEVEEIKKLVNSNNYPH